jgi:hypothetical protein
MTKEELEEIGIGYTIATGRLFCSFENLQTAAEVLLGRPVMTHEFADPALWDELRAEFQARATLVRQSVDHG